MWHLILACSIGLVAASQDACQTAADAYCEEGCFDDLSSGCDGPLVARYSGPLPRQWRCYSPSTLSADNATFEDGDCYCSRDAEISAVLSSCGVETVPSPETVSCQAEADAYCEQGCFDDGVRERGCDGPMVARYAGPGTDQWRCYSPSALDDANATYTDGDCYCSRNSEISGLLSACGLPAPISTVRTIRYHGSCGRPSTLPFCEQKYHICSCVYFDT